MNRMILAFILLLSSYAQAWTFTTVASGLQVNSVANTAEISKYVQSGCSFRLVLTRTAADPKNPNNVRAGDVTMIGPILASYTLPSGTWGTTYAAKEASGRNVYFQFSGTQMQQFESYNDLSVQAACY